jgi:hypothetical protein
MEKYIRKGSKKLIGNQFKIDLNHNGRLDAEDFKMLRSSMNGAWRKEHKYVNSTSIKNGKVIDYEVRYARKNNPSRTGYKDKKFYDGGKIEEVVLWATKIGEPDWEEKLITNNPSKIEEAKKWALANGFDRLRVSKINMSEKPNFRKTFNDGGHVTFKRKAKSIAKRFVGKSVEPKYQKEYGRVYDKDEALEVGNKIAGKMRAMGMEKKAFGDFLGKAKNVVKKNNYKNLDDKQVMLKNGDWVQVLDQSDDKLYVIDVSKLGTGAMPKFVSITEVDESSFMAGGKVKKNKSETKKSSNSTKRGGAMQLAKEIRKEGEKWTDAVKRANEQLKKLN